MFGPGYGFGAAGSTRRHRAASGGTPTPAPTATGTLTLAAIPSHEEKRIYQRATTSGGGHGKGVGNITLAISGALAGTVNIRILSDDLTTILQTLPDATLTNGQASLLVAGVDARTGWFHIEVRDSTGAWQRTTYKCGMGALFGFAGQSLMVRLFGRQSGSVTYASTGLTPNANTACLATWSEASSYMPSVATMPWLTPGDRTNGTGPNALGIGVFLDRMVALTGVNCGAIGHSIGGVNMFAFNTGQTQWTQLAAVIARAGGAFEGFNWGQGHGDSKSGVAPNWYRDGLTALFAQLTALNSFSGYYKTVWTIPVIFSTAWGTPYKYNRIRRGAELWANAGGGAVVHCYDIDTSDNIHQTQAGSATLGNHIYRTFRASYGATSGHGPALVSATRSGTTITVTLSNVGQSALNLVGAPATRCFVFPKGQYNQIATPDGNRFPVAAVSSPNATTLTLTLANDPGDGHELDLYVNFTCGPASVTVDNIYDDRIDGDGINVGRILQANTAAIVVAAPSPGGPVNAPPSVVAQVSPFTFTNNLGAVAYAASDHSGFGDALTAGVPSTTGADSFPNVSSGFTFEGEFTTPASFSGDQTIFSNGFYFVKLDSTGRLCFNGNTVRYATALATSKRYRYAYCQGVNGLQMYLYNVTDGVNPGRVYHDATPAPLAIPRAGSTVASARAFAGINVMAGGQVDDLAVFEIERYAGSTWTPPTTPLIGTETGLVALWPLDSNVADVVAW